MENKEIDNKEIEDEEMLVNETSEGCDLDLEAKAREDEYQRGYKSGYVIGFNEAREVLTDDIASEVWERAYLAGYEEGQADAADAVADDYYTLLRARHDVVVNKGRWKHNNAKKLD